MHLKHNFKSEAELKDNLDFIYLKSSEGKSFHGIIEVAFNEVTITTAIHNIKSNKGSKTPGVDKIVIDTYLQMDKEVLIKIVRESVKIYKAKPARRKYIEKQNGKMRPLGIPTMLDRIIQECIKIVLEPIAEAKFYPNSYGFRPYRATKHAVKDITTLISGGKKNKPIYAIEGDIKGYFDNINHKILLKKLWRIGVHDKRIIAIIKEMLTAGYIESESYHNTDTGTIQGGIISPLLANIYLNSFDWMVGKMYHYPKQTCKFLESDRRRLKNKGITPKFLIRYCDDWIILTTKEQEATRLLKYLNKYFKHKLKLELSEEKTLITNLTVKPAKFLGFLIKAELPRKTPQNPNPQNIVGKPYPDMSKIKAKVKLINKEIRKLRIMKTTREQATHIEKVNSMITGLTQYHRTAICSKAFSYIDDKLFKCANAVFKKKYNRNYKQYKVPLDKLANRPQRHKGYKSKTYAVKHEGMYIGITKAFLTHSQWEQYCFNQKTTPYTEEGRKLYLQKYKMKKKLPMDRPPLYDVEVLVHLKDEMLNNFEYFMNREYAYNRDKGKCKICGCYLKSDNRHCHRINGVLELNKINKVPNLAWLCKNCDKYVHGNELPLGYNKTIVKKIEKYRAKLI
jgi:RNA-directed DNA polymerase